MAIANIRKKIEGIYAAIDPNNSANRSKKARDLADSKYAHIIRVCPDRFSQEMTESINNAVKNSGLQSEDTGMSYGVANKGDVRTATDYVIQNHKKIPGFTHKSVFTDIKGGALIVNRLSAKSSQFPEWTRKLNAGFKEAVFNKWKKDFKANSDNPNIAVDSIGTEDVKTGKEVGFSHDKRSNIANSALLNWLEHENVGGTAFNGLTTEAMAEKVFSLLKIGWKREKDPITGKMEWIITGELAGKNPDYKAGQDLGQAWEQNILDRFDEVLEGKAGEAFKDAAFVGSEPFTHELATWEMKKIADNYLKDAGFTKGGQKITVKGVPKKPKKSKKSGKERNKKTTIKDVVRKIEAIAVVPVKKEKGKGKQASTGGARELTRLKKYIQGRLPAEVRRNMGRPALQNRTGRFSNSVQLLSLTEAQNTIMAKYTYLLSPYETFENKGKKRWPMAYNPKPLIAKSIRNLAQGRIEQKLTVRRV